MSGYAEYDVCEINNDDDDVVFIFQNSCARALRGMVFGESVCQAYRRAYLSDKLCDRCPRARAQAKTHKLRAKWR